MRKGLIACGLIAVGFTTMPAQAQEGGITQNDYMIDGEVPGVRLSVREKIPSGKERFSGDEIVVFVHGATYPCIPDFDLDVEGYSWMNYVVRHDMAAYCFDIRGYGGSSRPAALDAPPEENDPVVRAQTAIRDIEAVVDHVRAKHGVDSVNVIGWSWGAMTSPLFASIHPDKVNRLVLYAPIYDVGDHPTFGHGSGLEDPDREGHFNPEIGAYRLRGDEGTTDRWDNQIIPDDKTRWRDPEVLEAYLQANLKSDPKSDSFSPPQHRAPNGVLMDLYYSTTGRPLYDASNLTMPTMVIKGTNDPASLTEDAMGLFEQLTQAPERQFVLIGDSSHFLTLERKRRELWGQVQAFLEE
jgi:pimeloyl-ACP methyl ester carboxylesterase